MVTIEQKLTLFSKLLNQDIKEETDKKFMELEKEYEKRMAENKFKVDKEATEIVEQARRRAELKKVELISKGKLSSKKEMMSIKDELIARFMAALEKKVEGFVQSDAYKDYLQKLIGELGSIKGQEDNLVVYLTHMDYENNRGLIKDAFKNMGINTEKLTFKETKEDILGGLIIIDPVLSTRIDESIRAMINENKDQIIEKISLAIGEVGEEAHE